VQCFVKFDGPEPATPLWLVAIWLAVAVATLALVHIGRRRGDRRMVLLALAGAPLSGQWLSYPGTIILAAPMFLLVQFMPAREAAIFELGSQVGGPLLMVGALVAASLPRPKGALGVVAASAAAGLMLLSGLIEVARKLVGGLG
jgi:hypothetical protein